QAQRLACIRGDTASCCSGVRRLRVVDEADAVDLADELQAVRDAAERAQRFGDRILRDAGSARGSRRGGRVLPAVLDGAERLGGQAIAGGELDARCAAGNLPESP